MKTLIALLTATAVLISSTASQAYETYHDHYGYGGGYHRVHPYYGWGYHRPYYRPLYRPYHPYRPYAGYRPY